MKFFEPSNNDKKVLIALHSIHVVFYIFICFIEDISIFLPILLLYLFLIFGIVLESRFVLLFSIFVSILGTLSRLILIPYGGLGILLLIRFFSIKPSVTLFKSALLKKEKNNSWKMQLFNALFTIVCIYFVISVVMNISALDDNIIFYSISSLI